MNSLFMKKELSQLLKQLRRKMSVKKKLVIRLQVDLNQKIKKARIKMKTQKTKKMKMLRSLMIQNKAITLKRQMDLMKINQRKKKATLKNHNNNQQKKLLKRKNLLRKQGKDQTHIL